ncbi:MAG: ABC transporter permease, partial [Geminicoccales bacterium]
MATVPDIPSTDLHGGAMWRLRSGVSLLGESWPAMLGLTLVVFWVVVALLAPLLAPYDPNANDYAALANPFPSAEHWLGTDNQGRDILSRIIWGARTVLIVAPIAVVIAYAIGCAMGLVAGYKGGWYDVVLSRISDVILSFPVIILYMIIIANFGASAFNIIVAVTFTAAP